MIRKNIQKVQAYLQSEIRQRTEDLIRNPKRTKDKEDFLYKSGYLTALQDLFAINQKLLEGEDAP